MPVMQNQAWISAARLLRRSGFGATGGQIDAAVRRGYAATVEDIVAARADTDPGALATPIPELPTVPYPAGADAAARQRYFAALSAQIDALPSWWLHRMVAVRQPFVEKITWCWHNHFATSALKVRSAALVKQQNATLRSASHGRFGDLAHAMLIDSAMLFWLDGQANTRTGPNENLSREFMELFALGHGNGYTETDVREGARALTGWRITKDNRAEFVPAQHDPGAKTVLGVTGALDERQFADIVLARPESARFVAGRLYGQLVSDQPPTDATLTALVQSWGRERELPALYRALFRHRSFVDARGTSVANPVEWVVGALRALAVELPDSAAADTYVFWLRSLGQWPMYPPDVSGWPAGQAWLSTATADLRMQYALALAGRADLSFIETTAPAGRLEAIGYRLGIGAWSEQTLAALQPNVDDPARCLALALNSPEYLVH